MAEPYEIILSDNIASELDEIFDYIAQDSPTHAAKLIAQIRDAIDGLKFFPLRQIVDGEESNPNPLRSLPVGNYMIFFRVFETRHLVHVLHVRHGARRRFMGLN
jgi:plasmid stabilization system protein ParE